MSQTPYASGGLVGGSPAYGAADSVYQPSASLGSGASGGASIMDPAMAPAAAPYAASSYPVYDTEVGVSGPGGFVTTPGYPRTSEANPDAPSSPELDTSYPTTPEGMVPERVGQNPPLKPFPEQENYSYRTNTAASNSASCQICGEGYGSPYLWQIHVAAKIKHRERAEKSQYTFYNDSNAISANTDFPVAVGADLALTRYLGRNQFNYDIWLDFHFDGLYEWDANRSFYDANGLYSPYGVAGLTSYEYTYTKEDGETTSTAQSILTTLDLDYSASMNTGEIMFQLRKRGRPDPMVCHPNGRWSRKCQGGPRYTHLVGFRFTEYDEELNWRGTSSIYDKTDQTLLGYANGLASIETTNSMIGFSFGGEWVDKHCVWSWGFNWRITPYLNIMESSLYTTDYADNYIKSDVNETDIGYQVDLGVFATYKPFQHLILRFGYDASLLGNLAMANRCSIPNVYGAAVLSNNDYLIFQSLSFTAKFVW